jgi:hypothetical protein
MDIETSEVTWDLDSLQGINVVCCGWNPHDQISLLRQTPIELGQCHGGVAAVAVTLKRRR